MQSYGSFNTEPVFAGKCLHCFNILNIHVSPFICTTTEAVLTIVVGADLEGLVAAHENAAVASLVAQDFHLACTTLFPLRCLVWCSDIPVQLSPPAQTLAQQIRYYSNKMAQCRTVAFCKTHVCAQTELNELGFGALYFYVHCT